MGARSLGHRASPTGTGLTAVAMVPVLLAGGRGSSASPVGKWAEEFWPGFKCPGHDTATVFYKTHKTGGTGEALARLLRPSRPAWQHAGRAVCN